MKYLIELRDLAQDALANCPTPQGIKINVEISLGLMLLVKSQLEKLLENCEDI
jgi:hypothetical protein